MFAYIVRRIMATIPVMAVVALFVFSLLHLSPGDPAVIIAGDTATLDDIVRIRAKLGGEWIEHHRLAAARHRTHDSRIELPAIAGPLPGDRTAW